MVRTDFHFSRIFPGLFQDFSRTLRSFSTTKYINVVYILFLIVIMIIYGVSSSQVYELFKTQNNKKKVHLLKLDSTKCSPPFCGLYQSFFKLIFVIFSSFLLLSFFQNCFFVSKPSFFPSFYISFLSFCFSKSSLSLFWHQNSLFFSLKITFCLKIVFFHLFKNLSFVFFARFFHRFCYKIFFCVPFLFWSQDRLFPPF